VKEKATSPNGNGVEDTIQDESSEDETKRIKPAAGRIAQHNSMPPLKRPRSEFETSTPGCAPPSGSQKFLKTADGAKTRTTSTAPQPQSYDPRPWIEKYGPSDLSDLVVHKKKVADVRKWLEEALQGQRYRRLLVLKGPAGSGKTATVSLLASAMNFDTIEWRNPAAADFLSNDFVSASTQFEDFLGRSGKFGSLEFAGSDHAGNNFQSTTSVETKANAEQIILIEEFPTVVTRAAPALQAFRNTILQSLAVSSRILAGTTALAVNPIVMVISESTMSSASNPSEDFTAHRLLGPEILNHLATTVFEFNPVAPTYISRALKLTMEKQSRATGIRHNLSTVVLQKLSEIGDVRNAISTLEFLCLQMDAAPSASVTLPKGKRSRSLNLNPPASTSSDAAALSVLSLRESSLGLFHAVGRVLYNKRTVRSIESSIPVPPHQVHLMRPLAPEADVATLIDETGTDTSTFLAALHENYVLSCFDPGGDSEATLNSVNGCLDALCDADLLGASATFSTSASSGRVDDIRQGDLAFTVGVSGILMSLPHPVKRQPPPPVGIRPASSQSRSVGVVPSSASSGRNDFAAHRMYYPTSLKLWRAKDEAQGLLDHFTTRVLDGKFAKQLQQCRRKTLTALPVGQMLPPPRKPASLPANDTSEDIFTETVATGSGHSARQELLLERLPYLAHMLRATPGYPKNTSSAAAASTASLLRQIERVARFTGLRSGDEDDDGVREEEMQIDGGRAREIFGKVVMGSCKEKNGVLDGEGIRGLVLSDDDIVDD